MSDKTRHMSRDSEHYYAASDHTAAPDWLVLASNLSAESRLVVLAVLVLQKAGCNPTRLQLAELLGVDQRTIYRWLAELDDAGAIDRRRGSILFRSPQPDRTITDRMITDRTITDHAIRFTRSSESKRMPAARHKTPQPDRTISDPSHGGGGGSMFGDSESPPTTEPRRRIVPADITGATGRWMVAEGFSLAKAHQHQSLALGPAQADYQRRRQLGQRHGAIALAWEVSPPAGDSDSSPIEPSAGEFTFSLHEKERYRAMGFAIGDELPEGGES